MKILYLLGFFALGDAFYLPQSITHNIHKTTNARCISKKLILPQNQIPLSNTNNLVVSYQRSQTSLKMSVDWETVKPVVFNLVFFISVYGVLYYLISKLSGNNGNSLPGGMFNNKKKLVNSEMVNVKFADVAGIDYVKTEVEDIICYLKEPERFAKVGAKVPHGILLNGPPGTGKTLLAKAIAGEAGVPFFASDATEFIALYVGLGAKNIRELFEKARKASPSIVFIDEIDAIGGKRGMGIGGSGNDERDQTLNQLLIEMDGFSSNLYGENEAVIVIASTNRIDILDEALVRSGRFDRKIYVKRPDSQARREILQVHSKGKPLTEDVDFDSIVSQTIGNTGADLANIMNEAAILAMRQNSTVINNEHVSEALDKTLIGISLKDRKTVGIFENITSVHESGHALVSLLLGHNTLTRMSIVPTSNGIGGFCLITPDENTLDVGLVSKTYLLNDLQVLLGGRVSEEIMFGNDRITTGASSDLARAKQLVEEYLVDFCMDSEQLFGFEYNEKIHLIIQEYYKKTYELLDNNKHLINIFSNALKEKKVLYKKDIQELYQNNKLIIDTN
jgi:cell division protease FtsH